MTKHRTLSKRKLDCLSGMVFELKAFYNEILNSNKYIRNLSETVARAYLTLEELVEMLVLHAHYKGSFCYNFQLDVQEIAYLEDVLEDVYTVFMELKDIPEYKEISALLWRYVCLFHRDFSLYIVTQ